MVMESPGSRWTASPKSPGEMERLRAILWARLAVRINPAEDRLLVTADAAARLGVSTGTL